VSTIDASALLRPGLLAGVSVLLAGVETGSAGGCSTGSAVRTACAELGARVSVCEPLGDAGSVAEEAAIDEAVRGALGAAGSLELLVVDSGGVFAQAAIRLAGRDAAGAALRSCLQASWNATRAVVNHAFLTGGRGGRVVYIAPPADAGEHAEAARAGLENLARTLSIEWARHGITVVTIAPGSAAPAGEVAAITAYLASPAGAYFSGCVLDLRGAGG